ncbi:hypothetical protein BDA99DRAFT_500504 [Phascolomyces articulosus]|uniref:Uncharacterized protein n=1 Tax=Phascolomyces articulosus TaxID=60185 RepID=A0AAD5K6C7_9FUNG|nr:hypothetical protein BDA99DRAFT_500504 [Phascolomyces articulosus]
MCFCLHFPSLYPNYQGNWTKIVVVIVVVNFFFYCLVYIYHIRLHPLLNRDRLHYHIPLFLLHRHQNSVVLILNFRVVLFQYTLLLIFAEAKIFLLLLLWILGMMRMIVIFLFD